MNKHIITLALTFAMAITLGACMHHDHDHHHAEEGHDHHEKLHLTTYDAEYELYAKACPMVKGQAGSIELYITELQHFKAAHDVHATIALCMEGKRTEATEAHTHTHDVHAFELTPEATGKGHLEVTLKHGNATRTIRLADVTVYDDTHDAAHAAAHHMPTSSNGVAFEKAKSWHANFATEVCREEPAQTVIRTMAQILPAQGDEREIVAQSCGIVDFGKTNLVEGTAVRSGQMLLHIKGGDMVDNNLTVKYRAAESDYQLAKAEYERKTRLVEDKIVSQSEWLQAKRDLELSEEVYNNLRKNFSTDRHSIASPIAGYIKQLAVRNGEYVEAGTRIATIAQNQHLYIKANIQTRHYPALNHVVGANMQPLNSTQCYSLDDLGGRLLSYGKSVESNQPLLPVLFEVNNSAQLLPGTFVEMFIQCRKEGTALTVASDAIVEEMGSFFVFVQLTPEFFEKRNVTLGATDGQRTEIISGVKPGERVVTKGAVLVKLSQASGALDAHAGHVH